ncbi:MAG: hypothetical protein ACPGUY_08735, partial [Akkermansiaceae bacterium]
KNHDPIARANDLLSLIDGLGPNEFEQVVADFRASGLVRERMSEYAMLLHAWGKADPLAALDYAEKNTGTSFARQTILASWSADNPDAALSWAKSKHEGEGANPWLVGIIQGVATNDPSRATEIMLTLPFSRERGDALSAIIPRIVESGSDEAKAWLATISDERLRNGATVRVVSRLANNDPESTATWATSLSDETTRARAVGEVAEQWARKDLDAAVSWTNALNGKEKISAAGEIIGTYAREDAEKAASWLSTLSNEEGYERVQHSFIWNTARRNPAISLSQVASLSDERTQNRYYDRILRNWHENDANAAANWMNANNISDDIRNRVTKPRDDRRRNR